MYKFNVIPQDKKCPMFQTDMAADIVERLARLETYQENFKKSIEGNGKMGLMERVDALESLRDTVTGVMKATYFVAGIVATLLLTTHGHWLKWIKSLLAIMAG